MSKNCKRRHCRHVWEFSPQGDILNSSLIDRTREGSISSVAISSDGSALIAGGVRPGKKEPFQTYTAKITFAGN